MYEIEEVKVTGGPHLVRMSFEMTYRDWCVFQKTTTFHSLKKYLSALKTKRNLHKHPMP